MLMIVSSTRTISLLLKGQLYFSCNTLFKPAVQSSCCGKNQDLEKMTGQKRVDNFKLSFPYISLLAHRLYSLLLQKFSIHFFRDPQTMSSIRDGAHLSIVECQHQFRHYRWNCSTASRGNGAFGDKAQKGKYIFPKNAIKLKFGNFKQSCA